MGLLPPGGRRSVSPLLSSSLFLPQDGSGRAAGYGMANAQTGMERMACVFCRIRDGELPSTKVAEEERAFAFMDINPLNDGHVLVLTKAHAENLFDLAEEDLVAVARLAWRVAAGIRRGLAPDGLSLVQANGRAAFQSVPHFHVHLIPRWLGDGKGFDWTLVPGDPVDIQAAAGRIRAAL